MKFPFYMSCKPKAMKLASIAEVQPTFIGQSPIIFNFQYIKNAHMDMVSRRL